MTRKLFAFAQGKCNEEGMDPVMMQEITLAGHVYLQLLKDRMANWLGLVKMITLKKQRMSKDFDMNQSRFRIVIVTLKLIFNTFQFLGEMVQILAKCGKLDSIFENVLATGNVPGSSDLGLMQEAGKKILFKFLSKVFLSY